MLRSWRISFGPWEIRTCVIFSSGSQMELLWNSLTNPKNWIFYSLHSLEILNEPLIFSQTENFPKKIISNRSEFWTLKFVAIIPTFMLRTNHKYIVVLNLCYHFLWMNLKKAQSRTFHSLESMNGRLFNRKMRKKNTNLNQTSLFSIHLLLRIIMLRMTFVEIKGVFIWAKTHEKSE